MTVLSLFLALVIPVNLSLNCNVYIEKTFDGSFPYLQDHISSFKNLIQSQNTPISTEASITVFTHGMGMGHKDWYINDTQNSQHGNFGGLSLAPLSDASVIALKNDVLYDPNFNYDPNNSPLITAEHLYRPSLNEADTIDFSKPIFLVYQGPNDYYQGPNDFYHLQYVSNEELYLYFANALDAFLMEYYSMFGIVPKINLIGHSRGGLVNMIYAINHPQIIASFMSVGTPYVGSDWARVLWCFEEIDNITRGYNYLHTPYYGVIGEDFAETYAEDWNDIIEEFDFPTKVVGCCYTDDLFSESFLSFVTDFLSHLDELFDGTAISFFANLTTNLINSLASYILDVVVNYTVAATSLIVNGLLDIAAFAAQIAGYFNVDLQTVSSLLVTAFEQIAFVLTTDVFYPLLFGDQVTTDIAVNLNSQIGKTRAGEQVFDFDTEIVEYALTDLPTVINCRPEAPSVLHNWETHSPYVKGKFSSLLQANSECRHSHSFEVDNGTSDHTFACSCGATFHTCQGSYQYSNYDASQHLKTCSLCGYQRLTSHNYVYTRDSWGHSAICSDCGRQITYQSHDFHYTGTPVSHIGVCACGEVVIEEHNFVGGWCSFCNWRDLHFDH